MNTITFNEGPVHQTGSKSQLFIIPKSCGEYINNYKYKYKYN